MRRTAALSFEMRSSSVSIGCSLPVVVRGASPDEAARYAPSPSQLLNYYTIITERAAYIAHISHTVCYCPLLNRTGLPKARLLRAGVARSSVSMTNRNGEIVATFCASDRSAAAVAPG